MLEKLSHFLYHLQVLKQINKILNYSINLKYLKENL